MAEPLNYILAENKESTVMETMSQHILLTFYMVTSIKHLMAFVWPAYKSIAQFQVLRGCGIILFSRNCYGYV